MRGGEVVAQGAPEQVADEPRSFTGQYLRTILERQHLRTILERQREAAE